MFFKTSTVAFVALFALSSASPLLSERQNGVTCQTSGSSPVTKDITLVINEVNGKGGKCVQSNGAASDCTTLATEASGAIAVCGEEEDEDDALTCAKVADYATQIQTTCTKNGKAGGQYTVSASKRIILFNSEDA